MSRSASLVIAVAVAVHGCGAAPPAIDRPALPPTGASIVGEPVVLGSAPLCEASGAVFVPCASGAGRCLLVNDNERKRELFLFDVEATRLSNQRVVPLMSGTEPAELKDAEGMALLGEQIFLVGSHSRRSWDKKAPRCTRDDERRAFAVLRRDGDGFQTTPVRTALPRWLDLLQPAACRDELITPHSGAGEPLAARVCAALADGDAHAEENRQACARALNVEGVAAIPDGGSQHIWFGLRGPQIDGQAILLRLASIDSLRFDAVVSLDLGGDGVRDMTYASGWLWLLSGPAPDYRQPATIWRIPAASLVDGARLRPAVVISALPPFSEALAIDPNAGDAFLLVDGDEEEGPGDSNGCPTPARYLHLRLPGDAP